jgi:hypothetical protein
MNTLSPARSPAKSVPLVPAKAGTQSFARWIPAFAGMSGVLLRGRGGSFKWRHCPHANLVDSCNENLPTFGIHQICACRFGARNGAGRARRISCQQRRARPRPLLFACYGPVILLPAARFPIHFPRVTLTASVFFLLFAGRRANERSAFGSRSRRRRRASHVFVDRAAGDDGAHHAAFELGLVEGRVLAFRFKFRGVEHPGHVGIEHDHVRGAALPQRPGRKA